MLRSWSRSSFCFLSILRRLKKMTRKQWSPFGSLVGLYNNSNQIRECRALSHFISNKEALMAQYKRPDDETLGISRSVGKNTMGKAQKSLFHKRDQSRTPSNE
ncbi:hypothetical protein V1527DRAFT_264304 [Lipomyces starkeyi]